MQLLQSSRRIDLGLDINLLVEIFLVVVPEGTGLLEALTVVQYPRLAFNKDNLYYWVAINGINGFRWKYQRPSHRNASFLVFDTRFELVNCERGPNRNSGKFEC